VFPNWTSRSIALNRKNALFAGSDGGAEHWAIIASLIETCKLNGVDPYAYLAATITKIVNGHPNARLDELLPWAYPYVCIRPATVRGNAVALDLLQCMSPEVARLGRRDFPM
jgi:hypothetical protein